MYKVYAEYANGDRKTFRDIDEENAICKAIYYAEKNDTEIVFYTEVD